MKYKSIFILFFYKFSSNQWIGFFGYADKTDPNGDCYFILTFLYISFFFFQFLLLVKIKVDTCTIKTNNQVILQEIFYKKNEMKLKSFSRDNRRTIDVSFYGYIFLFLLNLCNGFVWVCQLIGFIRLSLKRAWLSFWLE